VCWMDFATAGKQPQSSAHFASVAGAPVQTGGACSICVCEVRMSFFLSLFMRWCRQEHQLSLTAAVSAAGVVRNAAMRQRTWLQLKHQLTDRRFSAACCRAGYRLSSEGAHPQVWLLWVCRVAFPMIKAMAFARIGRSPDGAVPWLQLSCFQRSREPHTKEALCSLWLSLCVLKRGCLWMGCSLCAACGYWAVYRLPSLMGSWVTWLFFGCGRASRPGTQ
jgi:hypothetical protein